MRLAMVKSAFSITVWIKSRIKSFRKYGVAQGPKMNFR